MAQDKKPGPNAPRDAIVTWYRRQWSDGLWGNVDCSDCPERTGTHPCGACARWDAIVREHRDLP